MRSMRRRSDRPEPTRRRTGAGLEALESRALLSNAPGLASFQSLFHPSEFAPRTVTHRGPISAVYHPVGVGQRQLSQLDNEGKVLTGKDREGDEWILTVHGPGSAIVVDATPGDGILGDDIASIVLVGTSLQDTYVTGQTTASARGIVTDGKVFFNFLYAPQGVHSIILNGFDLARTVTPPLGLPNNATTEVFLPGGVQVLSFGNIIAPIDRSLGDFPIDIIIGDPTTPLAVQPIIQLGAIYNTSFDSLAVANPILPQTTPTVNIIVNGQIRSLDTIAATHQPIDAALQALFPPVGITGRTSIRATGIDHLRFAGNAKNVTVSRGQFPFRNSLSGVSHIGSVRVGGNADAFGLDVVEGRIGRIVADRGLGNPIGSGLAATTLGTPVADFGYPAFGLQGALIRARRIGKVAVGPAKVDLLTPNDRDYTQEFRTGQTVFYPTPGPALTSALIASSESIGETTIVGHTFGSEIRSGFFHPAYTEGLQPVRAPSRIRPYFQRGSLVDSATAATYRPNDFFYNNGDDIAGPGLIAGAVTGDAYDTERLTTLANQGSGVFARRTRGPLPPPNRPRRVHGVLFR